MACSKFEYVKKFEQHTALLPNTFIVVRIDGHAFHRFTKDHGFTKPNDRRGTELMICAAKHVMSQFDELKLAFGQSDEFSFVFSRSTQIYQRREAKLISTICSQFTSAFVLQWSKYFDNQLKYPPSFGI